MTSSAPTVDEATLRAAIGPLFMLASSGKVPTTWDDQTRADAQMVLDAFEDALVEVAS